MNMSIHHTKALNAQTNEFIPIDSVDPSNRGDYICSVCRHKVVFRNCTIKINHFAHLSLSNCMGESDIHKFGKTQLKRWLDQGYSIIIKNTLKTDTIEKGENDTVYVEKGNGSYIADVAIHTDDNKPKVIFEVTHTHETTTPRPCKWYNIYASNIVSPLVFDLESKTVILAGSEGKVKVKQNQPKKNTMISKYREADPDIVQEAEWNGNRVKRGAKVVSKGYKCDICCFRCRKYIYYPVFSRNDRCFYNLCAYGCEEETCEII